MNQELNMDEAQIGRVLHFVLEGYQGRPQCRPALVVEDWPSQGKPGYVNLCVFPDGTNDGKYGTDDHDHGVPSHHEGQSPERSHKANLSMMTHWETSVLPNHAVKAVRTWHWPRECRNLQNPAEPYVNSAKERYQHNHAEGVVDVHNCTACKMEERAIKQVHA